MNTIAPFELARLLRPTQRLLSRVPGRPYLPAAAGDWHAAPKADTGNPATSGNHLHGLGIDAVLTHDHIRHWQAAYRDLAIQHCFAWLHPGPWSDAAGRALLAGGFRPLSEPSFPTLFHDLETVSLPQVPLMTTVLDAVPVDGGQRKALQVLYEANFPNLAALLKHDHASLVLACDGQVVVAAALLWLADDLAYLGWASTHPQHRLRGAQSLLIARRLQLARDQGCRVAVAETLSSLHQSQRNLTRAGFRLAYNKRVLTWDALLQ